MKIARLPEVELEYEVTGEGEPILFISPVLADGFRPLLDQPKLADRHRLIHYHRRGWVRSTRTPGAVSVAQHAADAAALLQYLEIDQAHVVGHSSGAAVAVELAIEHPGAVQTIALLELSLLALPKGQEFLGGAAPVMDLYAAGRNEEAFAAFMSAVSGLAWEDCRTLLEARIPGLVEQSVADADTFFGVELPALADWSLHQERAGRIEQPVLSVIGTETQPLWFEVAEFLRCHVPRIEEARISGAGHLLHIQEPDAVTDAVASFLEGHRIGQP